ncbi:uncharacterized protein J4E78_001373 [Alternaria triticimaculans]|uniref:uncharacterized protein n=1 Tax=Alternaria triticimaculans TaxID=297637 RepID=UPI0020C51F82|nr:uncharacterized protein J4E78_001373 [Alternaria triticimaculans]KAI4672870.1 hypothetical protein J4E78_001373 [Alternaria triticimaculans]
MGFLDRLKCYVRYATGEYFDSESANTAPNTSYEHEQTSESETDLLIPYVSDDDDDSDDEANSNNDAGSFGHCWHCDAPLPLPTSDETNVDCLECQFPN